MTIKIQGTLTCEADVVPACLATVAVVMKLQEQRFAGGIVVMHVAPELPLGWSLHERRWSDTGEVELQYLCLVHSLERKESEVPR